MNRTTPGALMSHFGRWALRAIGPVLLIVLLWQVVDYAELRDIVGGIQIPWALAALAAVQLIIVLRTLRWAEIHEAFGLSKATFGYQLRLTYATNLATMVLPQILNPLSRFVLLLQDGYRARQALPGSILEKVLDLVAYVSFGVYGSIALVTIFGGIVWWAVGLALVALGSGAALYWGRSQLSDIAQTLIERFPGSGEGADQDRSEVAREIVSLNPQLLLRLFGWSLAICLTQATLLFFLARSLGVELSYQFMVAVWGVIALSFLLPISVNGIGTREAILVVAFDAADKSTDAAVALGLLVLAVVAIGSAPGAIEWLRRSVAGGGRPYPAAQAQRAAAGSVPPTARPGNSEGLKTDAGSETV